MKQFIIFIKPFNQFAELRRSRDPTTKYSSQHHHFVARRYFHLLEARSLTTRIFLKSVATSVEIIVDLGHLPINSEFQPSLTATIYDFVRSPLCLATHVVTTEALTLALGSPQEPGQSIKPYTSVRIWWLIWFLGVTILSLRQIPSTWSSPRLLYSTWARFHVVTHLSNQKLYPSQTLTILSEFITSVLIQASLWAVIWNVGTLC
jgi:hypothetical protein